jgi:transposase
MSLLSECLDDYVSEDKPMRVVEAFIDALDLENLGFAGMFTQATGRPAYHPTMMLKLYVYGYLDRARSSRRLKRECQRNLELIWLAARLVPDFKTIANFRKDNGRSSHHVCKQFVSVCRKLNLISQSTVVLMAVSSNR